MSIHLLNRQISNRLKLYPYSNIKIPFVSRDGTRARISRRSSGEIRLICEFVDKPITKQDGITSSRHQAFPKYLGELRDCGMGLFSKSTTQILIII
jgi:hypothetical protein